MVEWVSLLSLITAALTETAEGRKTDGPALDKTVVEWVRSAGYGPFVDVVQDHMEEHGMDFQGAIRPAIYAMASATGKSVEQIARDRSLLTLWMGIYNSAAFSRRPTVWKLDEEAFDALLQTEPPYDLLEERLPRLPFPGLMLMLPEGTHLKMPASMGQPERAFNGLLISEEVPGKLLRFYAFRSDGTNNPLLENDYAKLDLSVATIREQLEGDVALPTDTIESLTLTDTGHAAFWRIILNLLLSLEHKHLVGQAITPKEPRARGAAARRFTKRKTLHPYTLVRLSQGIRDGQAARQAKSDTGPPAGREHLVRQLRRVRGHWRTYWVLNPDDEPVIFASREKNGRMEYKVARWIPPFWRVAWVDPERLQEQPKQYRVTKPKRRR